MARVSIDEESVALGRVRAHMKERMPADFKAGKLDTAGYDALQVELDAATDALNAAHQTQQTAKLARDKVVKKSKKARADYGREVSNLFGVGSPEFQSIPDKDSGSTAKPAPVPKPSG